MAAKLLFRGDDCRAHSNFTLTVYISRVKLRVGKFHSRNIFCLLLREFLRLSKRLHSLGIFDIFNARDWVCVIFFSSSTHKRYLSFIVFSLFHSYEIVNSLIARLRESQIK